MNNHTTAAKGKRVMVILKDGSRFVDKFIESKSKQYLFKGRKVAARDIRSMSIYRG